MSTVFKPVVIKWRGEEYEIVANMRVINAIENDVNLAKLATRVAAGDPPLSQIATVYTHLLNAAGASVSSDDVYAEMYGSGDVIGAACVALEAVYPSNAGGVKSKKKKAG